MMASITRKAPVKPNAGLTIIGMATFSTILSQSTVTPEARPAPTSPPISACEDDDGMPKYHVMRFQVMAPTKRAHDDGEGMVRPSRWCRTR